MNTPQTTCLATCGFTVLLVSLFTQQNHAANNATLASADEPLIGEVRLVAFNFNPRGWENCDGQLLPISSNTALFSLLGTTYGGDGRTTFALPDLRGRAVIHSGNGPGLVNVNQGQKTGGVKVDTDADSATSTQPALGMRYVIATRGIFPSRN